MQTKISPKTCPECKRNLSLYEKQENYKYCVDCGGNPKKMKEHEEERYEDPDAQYQSFVDGE